MNRRNGAERFHRLRLRTATGAMRKPFLLGTMIITATEFILHFNWVSLTRQFGSHFIVLKVKDDVQQPHESTERELRNVNMFAFKFVYHFEAIQSRDILIC